MEFARLYFTSNEELIGLMGNLSDTAYLQVFLSKLFAGVAGLLFEKDMATGFFSSSQENLYFVDPINTGSPPEMWLKEVEVGMKQTLYVSV